MSVACGVAIKILAVIIFLLEALNIQKFLEFFCNSYHQPEITAIMNHTSSEKNFWGNLLI